LVDDLVHVRLQGTDASARVKLGDRLPFSSVLDRVGLAEEVEQYLPVDESTTTMIEGCLDVSTLERWPRFLRISTNFQPFTLKAEDDLDKLGNVNIYDAGGDADDWSVFLVQLLKNEM
jgi:hypothetical protein